MIPTPSTSHVDVGLVYEPAEDSFLLMDSLSSPGEITYLTERFNHPGNATVCRAPIIAEFGVGSGVIAAFVTANARTLFGRSDVLVIGGDVNPVACRASIRTVQTACVNSGPSTSGSGVFATTLNADLGAPLRRGTLDVIIFNPPYVPSETVPDPESSKDLLALSYEGGKDGMEVTNRLLDELPWLLDEERGVAYILLCHQNNPLEVRERIASWHGLWKTSIIRESGRTGGWEKLQILRIERN